MTVAGYRGTKGIGIIMASTGGRRMGGAGVSKVSY